MKQYVLSASPTPTLFVCVVLRTLCCCLTVVLLQVRIRTVRTVTLFRFRVQFFFSGPNYLCAFLTICLINLKLLKLVSLAISRLLAVHIIMK